MEKQASALSSGQDSRQPGSLSEPLLNLILCRLNGIDRRLDALEKEIKPNGTQNVIVLDKEHDRVLKEIDLIEGSYAGHQTMSQADRDRLKVLRARRNEIRAILGIKM